MLQALRDEIIVKPVYEERKSIISIPQSALKFRQYDGQVYGEVISAGPKHKLGVIPGDKINWQRHEGKKITYQGQIYFVVKQRWVMAKVDLN